MFLPVELKQDAGTLQRRDRTSASLENKAQSGDEPRNRRIVDNDHQDVCLPTRPTVSKILPSPTGTRNARFNLPIQVPKQLILFQNRTKTSTPFRHLILRQQTSPTICAASLDRADCPTSVTRGCHVSSILRIPPPAEFETLGTDPTSCW